MPWDERYFLTYVTGVMKPNSPTGFIKRVENDSEIGKVKLWMHNNSIPLWTFWKEKKSRG